MSADRDVSRAASWTAASRVVSQLAQLTVFLVAARYLSTEDFGAFSLLSAVSMLMARLGQAGWLELATAWQGDAEVEAHAFTLAVLGSVGISTLGIAFAVVCTQVSSLTPYALLAALLSLSVAGVGANAYWSGLLLRRQRGDALGKIALVSQLMGSLVALGGLFLGGHFVALGLGKLVTHAVEVAMTAWVVRWMPAFRLSSGGAQVIGEYTKGMTSSKLVTYARGYAATLLIGVFLGPAPVGLYRAAQRLVAALGEAIGEPARIVCWMMLRRAAEHDAQGEAGAATGAGTRPSLALAAEGFLVLIVLLATPVFVGVAVASEAIVHVMLGERWLPCAPVVAILAIARLVNVPFVLSTPLLSMGGHVDRIPRLALQTGLITLLALPPFAPFGEVWIAVGQLLAAAMGLLVVLRAYQRYADVRWLAALARTYPSLIAVVAMGAVVTAARSWIVGFDVTVQVRLIVEVVAGAASFALAFLLTGGIWRLRAAYSPAGFGRRLSPQGESGRPVSSAQA
ncbi:MAG: oligosaccharide flippase family protein [Myxococcales bacterium]|nr:oligosaccharide flippase family protein [Myxococcales bacterium]